ALVPPRRSEPRRARWPCCRPAPPSWPVDVMQRERSRDVRQRQCEGTGKIKRARQRVAQRLDQMRLGPLVQRSSKKRRAASGQSEPRRADADEPIGEHVDVPGGEGDQFARNGIVPRCVLENIRSQRSKITWRSR